MKIEVIEKKNVFNQVLCSCNYGQFLAYWSDDDINENAFYDVTYSRWKRRVVFVVMVKKLKLSAKWDQLMMDIL